MTSLISLINKNDKQTQMESEQLKTNNQLN